MAKPLAHIHADSTSTAAHDVVDGPVLACAEQAFRYTPLLDSRLIVQIGLRNEQALGTLYDHYGALVYTIALRITQDRALAETIVQDVFHAVWQSASSFQIGASVPGWLTGMARQQAIAATQPHRDRTRIATHPENHTIRDHTQSKRIADARNAPRLLNALPADQRETIELAYYDGLTCREIAARLRESVSTIKTRLRKGLRALSEDLSNDAANLGEWMNGKSDAPTAADEF